MTIATANEMVARQLSKRKAITCPSCQAEISLVSMVRIEDESSVRFRISPKPGSLLTAATVGGMLSQLARINDIASRSMGLRCETLVRGAATDEHGEVTFDLLLMNAPTKRGRKKRIEGEQT